MGKNKYFLIYIDILGFVEKAKIDADKSIRPEERRKIYQERITHKLSQLKENETVLDFQKMGLDSWLLFTDSIRKAFRSIGEILKTDLSFEIAIEAKKFDESPAGGELIVLRDEIMDYLKTNILSQYKEWYRKEYEYLFSWNNHPGNDSEKLLRFLRDDLDIGWAENVKIHKSDDGKTICIHKDENSAEIMIDEKNEKATLSISDGRIHDLKVKKENEKLNIYKYEKLQTFILLTPEAYEELESLTSKTIAHKPYESADFYLLEQEEFERKLDVLEFLEKIGLERDVYREIEELYVEPENYTEIEEILRKYNIVFIIGDAEMGKTYTAVKLLFEFYKRGYEPQYISIDEEMKQFIKEKSEFEEKAVYLEDPWGKVKFRRGESVAREIGDFIISVKKKKCKIIITSREKVFKEFEKSKTTAEDLWQYVSNLKVNLAYTHKELREMLKRYITVFEPEWSKKEKLRENVFRTVGEKLKTPMSIDKMIRYTEDALDEDSLMLGIERASKETKIEFAMEIREMFNKGRYDKIVFLCFPFIGVRIETAKSSYNDCLKDLGYSLKADEFETLLEDFKEVEQLFGSLRFIHPSYWEAFSHALIDNDRLSNICKKIFFNVSISLAKKDEVAPLIIWAVSPDFDKLLRDDKPSLDAVIASFLRYANEFDNYGGVARSGADWISDNRDWILDFIAEYITRNVPRARIVLKPLTKGVLTIPANKMANHIAEKLRDEVAQKYEDVGKTVRAMVEKLKSTKLSAEDVKKWIFGIADVYETNGKTIRDIASKLRLSNEVVFAIAEKYEASGEYARSIAENFDLYVVDKPPFRIAKDFKDLSSFLLSLSEREDVARAATSNLDKLPIEIKIKLIVLISRTISCGTLEGPNEYKNFAFEILDKLSKDESEEVRTRAEELMTEIY